MMDATLIQEIANQLGMAVDQAGQFIQDQLPQYAALKAMQGIVPIVVSGIFIVVSLVAIAFIMANGKRWLEDRDLESIAVAGLILAIVALAMSVFVIVLNITDVIGWSNYPDAMLIDMAINAVG